MSNPTRFIMVAVGGWIAVRALSLGLIPGGEALAFDRPGAPAASTAPLPPVVATDFAPLDPVTPPAAATAPAPTYAAYPAPYPQPYAVPYGVPVAYGAALSRGAARPRFAASSPLPEAWGPAEARDFSLAPRHVLPTRAPRSTSGRSPPAAAAAQHRAAHNRSRR
jgi:hypothetical protein